MRKNNNNVYLLDTYRDKFRYQPDVYGIGHIWKVRTKRTPWELNQERVRKQDNRKVKQEYRV